MKKIITIFMFHSYSLNKEKRREEKNINHSLYTVYVKKKFDIISMGVIKIKNICYHDRVNDLKKVSNHRSLSNSLMTSFKQEQMQFVSF